MELEKVKDITYTKYRIGGTKYIVEICENQEYEEFVDVWLYKEGYGAKSFVFAIEKKEIENDLEIIETNIIDYIAEYENDFCII